MKTNKKNGIGFLFTALVAGTLVLPCAGYAEPTDNATMSMHMKSSESMDHSKHMKMMQSMGHYTTREARYELPDIELVRMDGSRTTLGKELDTENGVMMNFIFTSCTTICPTMSAIFSSIDKKIVKSGKPIKLISISIDPEYDTPANLRKYSEKFHASKNWHFFTGKLDDIVKLQKTMEAYRGNKMNHFPATFVRRKSDSRWLRIEGFVVAKDLIHEYDKLTTAKVSQ